MSAFKTWHLDCDHEALGEHDCYVMIEAEPAETLTVLRRQAWQRGWSRIGGKDYCPSHSPPVGIRPVRAPRTGVSTQVDADPVAADRDVQIATYADRSFAERADALAARFVGVPDMRVVYRYQDPDSVCAGGVSVAVDDPNTGYEVGAAHIMWSQSQRTYVATPTQAGWDDHTDDDPVALVRRIVSDRGESHG